MDAGSKDNPAMQWSVGEIKQGTDTEDASIEVYVSLEDNYRPVVRYLFQYNRTSDGAGTIYIPGWCGSSVDDKVAERDNRAAFEAACAVAEETGTRAEIYVKSQKYLNSISRESLEDLIGQLGQEEARSLLEEAIEESDG